MESDTEEVEIKIEYNESLDTDPLCEKYNDVLLASGIDYDFNDSDARNLCRNEEEDIRSDDEADDMPKNTLPPSDKIDRIQNKEAIWYKTIDSSGRYLCSYCDLTYSTIQTLRYHVKSKHPENETHMKNIIMINLRNKRFKCHICKLKFKVLDELQEHVKEKHDLDNLKASCNYCNATFSNAKEMLEHLVLKHKKTDKNFFTCTLCGYRTFKKSHFSQHLNTHFSVKKYNCDICDYKTNYVPNLTIHKRIHSADKPYRCNFNGCAYRCAAKSALSSHLLKHNKDQNLLYCEKCSYRTVYKQSLKKHLDSHRRNCIGIKL